MKLKHQWILDDNRIRIQSWCAKLERTIQIKEDQENFTRKKARKVTRAKRTDPNQLTLDLMI